jgi:2-succinyl-6-hydroxy-2,4-cyclohexadiene-1-carboxylate synthase
MPSLTLKYHGTGSPLLWLHGFTQTRLSSHRFLSILAGDHEVATVDLPGHGDASDTTADLPTTADLLAEVLAGRKMDVVGYSYGGRVALHLALAHPELVRRLVLVSTTPGLVEPVERAERVAQDEARAQRIEEVGADAFIDEWLRLPLFGGLVLDEVERQARQHQSAAGLAGSLRLSGTGTQHYLAQRSKEITSPVLLLTGERDEKFTTLASTWQSDFANAHHHVITESSHAVTLEQPVLSADAVLSFLASNGASAPHSRQH